MCSKTFEKPIVMTDSSQLVRETYYACPHCRSKVEVILDDPIHPRLASVEDAFYIGRTKPTKCPHHLGYLREQPENASIPDECAICPKVMQCFIKKDKC
jgi:DNA-directed RNA polymerase subunit RPC12/RpoP